MPAMSFIDVLMKFFFFVPELGKCTARLWARGAYGFSAPQKVEISAPGGIKATYSYRSLHEAPDIQVNGKIIVRIAIAQFLAAPLRRDAVELDSNMPMFDGRLIRPANWPRVGPFKGTP